MFHKGLNRDAVVAAAKKLVEEKGYNSFSMRALAESVGVKTASLYSHIESMEKLFTEVGLSALKQQRDEIVKAVGEKRRDDAVRAAADAYRQFASEHAELYKLIMQMPHGEDEVLKEAASMTAEPFMLILNDYEMVEEQKMHWQRALRGVMHGFVSEEQAGYFSHYPVDIGESYETAIECMIEGLCREEGSKDE